ncbi:MAG: RagB/SusD family nutrient uptake outer membrane protein [Prevotellaceae bacterium]|jgi:hypothetical protein|nr:RagB/SusD family nutrient uptake outer membrane protein [Prevotellaceae bacterium]
MKKILKYSAIFILFAALPSSCRDFLNVDDRFGDELKLDSVFQSARYLEAYMWGAGARFSDEGNLYVRPVTPGPMASDEGFSMHSVPGMSYVLGEISADNLGNFDQWGEMYKIIRKCNTIISHIDEVPDMEEEDYIRIISYTRFFRAYAYYHLLMNFGPPILLGDEVMETNAQIQNYDRPRSTYDEAMEYICTEFETAAEGLPLVVPIMDFGLPTRGAAYGLVARLRLIHASPLYNGGAAARLYFGKWTRKTDGKYYVNQQYDERRWAIAAAAALRVMEMKGMGGLKLYDLYTVPADDNTVPLSGEALTVALNIDPAYSNRFPDGAAGIDHYKSYSEIFNGEAPMTFCSEYVWARESGDITRATQYAFPYTLGGFNGQCVTQKVVDAYLMDDGRTKEAARADNYYQESGFTSQTRFFSGYRLNNMVFNMYANREMRFYASVGFSGCIWNTVMASGTQGMLQIPVSYAYDSPNGKLGPTNPTDYPITGYVLRKGIHPADVWIEVAGARRSQKAFSIVRYAEILLSYAEAINNLSSSHTVEMDGQTYTFTRDVNEIKRGFNPVRYRAGLPGLGQSQLNNRAEVQKQIERERMVEFLFENRRYFDVRRWGIYEDTEREPVMGMNTEGSGASYNQRVVPNTSRVGRRAVNRKMVFLPLPRNELKRLPSLDQNPGWE